MCGIQGVVLENHGDVAVFGLDVIDELVADVDFAFGDFLETGDHAQGGRFAATGRTDEDDEFLVSDFDVEIADRNDATFISFEYILQGNTGHNITSKIA